MYLHKLSSVRVKKRRLAQRLLENTSRLREGLWLLFEPQLAHHRSVGKLPESLLSTKSIKRIDRRSLAAFFRKLSYIVIPPFIVYVKHPGKRQDQLSSDGAFTILVCSKSSDAILINVQRKQVARICKECRIDNHRKELRRRLGRFFLLPKIEVLCGGEIIRETLFDGQSFVSLNAPLRMMVTDQILGQYERLTIAEAEVPPKEFWDEVLLHIATLPLPDSARLWANRIRKDLDLPQSIRQLPFTPAHGDLSGDNIIVTENGAGLIDLEDCASLPAFFDLFFLSHQELLAGRPDVWRHLMAGGGWMRIASGLASSHLCRTPPDRQTWLAALFCAECFMWRSKLGAKVLDETTLSRWWTPIMSKVS